MQSLRKHLVWREGALLVALLALLLAPLAQAVSRGYFAQDAVNVAAGQKPLALCIPGDPASLPAESSGQCCDLCLPSVAATLAASDAPVPARTLALVLKDTAPPFAAVRSVPSHPPPRGPPSA